MGIMDKFLNVLDYLVSFIYGTFVHIVQTVTSWVL